MQKLMLGVFLVGLLFTTGCSLTTECPECKEETCPECEECPEEKAMLSAETYDWAINLYDESEMFFDYWVYNYGPKEARNVIIKCALSDKTGKTIKTTTENIGNVASTSMVFKETITKKPTISSTEEYNAVCYVGGCDNCEILYKRIPELREELK